MILPITKSCCGFSRWRSSGPTPITSRPTLDLEIAKLAVREFEEGTGRETIEDFEGKILLARSDLERASDRVAWSHRMKDKGYIPAAAVTAEEFKQSQMMLALAQQESAFELFKKYTAPKTSKVLKGAVTAAETTLNYQTLRLRGIAIGLPCSRSRWSTARSVRRTTAS